MSKWRGKGRYPRILVDLHQLLVGQPWESILNVSIRRVGRVRRERKKR